MYGAKVIRSKSNSAELFRYISEAIQYDRTETPASRFSFDYGSWITCRVFYWKIRRLDEVKNILVITR